MNKKFNLLAWLLPFITTGIVVFVAQVGNLNLGAIWVVGVFLGTSAIVAFVTTPNKNSDKSQDTKSPSENTEKKAKASPKSADKTNSPKKTENGMWICPECEAKNLQKVKTCYNCGTERP